MVQGHYNSPKELVRVRPLTAALAGDMEDSVGVFGVLVQDLDRLLRWKRVQFHVAAFGLLLDLLHDGEIALGAGADDQALALPGNLLLDRQRCVAEVGLEFFGRVSVAVEMGTLGRLTDEKSARLQPASVVRSGDLV